MSRAARLFDILQILRRHRRPVSGATLAGEAGISLRTLYRDIAALQALGAGIQGEPGLGYVLKPGFLLPPLMFSGAEIEALALGLKWVGRRTDEAMGQAAQDAMAKLAAVLPAELRDRLEDDALLIGPGRERPQAVDLALLRRALNDERKLALSYVDEKGAKTVRIVWPVTLGFFDTSRMLAAWCELRQDFRSFRTDRILSAELLAERLPQPRRKLIRQWRQSMLTKTDSMRCYSFSRSRKIEEPPMNKELVFFTHPQSRSAIVHWMLEEIGCPYTVTPLAFGAAMKSPDFLAVNPMGKVPAIRHGDEVVTEAAAICAYLADAFPEAGLAPAPAHRAAYYRWLFFAAACVEPAMSNHSAGWDPATPEMRGRFGYGCYQQTLDALALWLRGRRHVAGDQFTAADIYVASMLNYGMAFGVIEKRPEFEAYAAPLVARPARKRVEEQVQALMAQKAWQAA